MTPSDAPLGVFDSGLGGLTVVRALREALPYENILYLGDTARVPYGTRSPTTVVKYALGCTRHLVARGVKAIVVACNTVSAVAPERLRIDLDLPVLEVIEPGARAAVAASRTGRIGLLATQATVNSGAYARAIAAASTRAEVIGRAAPLLVPLVEEGWLEGDVPRLAVVRYLEAFVGKDVDVVLLGCTHYPLLRPILETQTARLLGPDVRIVDSAHAAAADTGAFLRARGLARRAREPGRLELFVTDVPKTFGEVAGRFLGGEVPEVEQVDL